MFKNKFEKSRALQEWVWLKWKNLYLTKKEIVQINKYNVCNTEN